MSGTVGIRHSDGGSVSGVRSFPQCDCKQSWLALGGLVAAIITHWRFYTGIGLIKGEIYQQMANNMHHYRTSAVKQSRYRIYQLNRCSADVRRIHSLGCKNTSGQNEVFFLSLPDIWYKKE
jgi:hypothetical protein